MKKLSGKAFLTEISQLAATLQQQIEADCAGFPSDPAASTARRARAVADFPYFRRTYFPHYCSVAGDSALHQWLDDALPRMVADAAGQHLALAAPRGEAKSTFIGLFFVLWCVLTARKKYVLIIADALEQAAILLEAVKVELDSNPRLGMDFPEATGPGRVWNVGTVVTMQNVKLQALGAGKRMRGLRHGPYRPDLVVLDDLENDENVKKPEQRDKLQEWLQKTVLNLGSADGSMDVVYVGTILHYDSVLARTLSKPTWQTRKFRAVIAWPDRLDLWDKWEALLQAEGPEAARAFYEAVGEHPERYEAAAMEGGGPRSASAAGTPFPASESECRTGRATERHLMERGASVSWPAGRSLYRLMTIRADDHNAFDSEYQNDPLSGDDAPFATCITFWVDRRRDWLVFGAVDPSLGKAGAGRDPSAILVGGLHRETMTLDVIEASIRKRHPDRIIEDIISLHLTHHPLMWAVEAVQFQEFFAHVLAQRAQERGIALPVRPIINSTDKVLRIESLQPHMVQKRIRLHPSQQTLVDQLRHFPKADHDDGPDALEMLWRLAVGGFVSLRDAFERVPNRFFFDSDPYGDIDEPFGSFR